eukprot:GHVS01025785.1.p1 GENE.GHVS01025785.1~~GHVS01025785.1.p1  ORF type:complete len:792 (+),score=116.26 GHVS01025785.1:169-2544(+)
MVVSKMSKTEGGNEEEDEGRDGNGGRGGGGVISLPSLQNKIKRDPAAYEADFSLQFSHFEATLELFKASPHKPAKEFTELVMFIAQTAPCYATAVSPTGRSKSCGNTIKAGYKGGSMLARLGGCSSKFADMIIQVMQDNIEALHGYTRKALVAALILLRNRSQISTQKLLPVWFHLFGSEDKHLRSSLFAHIIKDIAKINTTDKSHQSHTTLKTYLYQRIFDQHPYRCRRAIAILIELYRQRVWIDDRTVNVIASATLSPDSKVCVAAATFLMGFKAKCSETVETDDEEDNPEEDLKATRTPIGSKETIGKLRKQKRQKSALSKVAERKARRRADLHSQVSFAALDVLHDPQSLAEQLFDRVSAHRDSFTVRIVLMNFISRLIGRHQLILLNFYPYVQKYLNPRQRHVTQILAIIGQASHELVPPHELEPTVRLIMNQFASEHQSPEIITVGINSIRMIATRAPLCVSEEMLADLAEFRNFKHKGVVGAARSLINLFRELYPSLLHRRLRGKEAAMNVSAKEDNRLQYGERKVTTTASFDKLKEEQETEIAEDASDGNDSDESDWDVVPEEEEEEEEEEGADEGEEGEDEEGEDEEDGGDLADVEGEVVEGEEVKVSTKTKTYDDIEGTVAGSPVVVSVDLEKGEAVANKKSKGKKDEDDEEEEINEMAGFTEMVNPEDLRFTCARKKRSRDDKLKTVLQGREGREKFGTKKDQDKKKKDKGLVQHGGNRKGLTHSMPNTVKARHKPISMKKESRVARHRSQDSNTKLTNLRAHIKLLKKKTGGKPRRRRM